MLVKKFFKVVSILISLSFCIEACTEIDSLSEDVITPQEDLEDSDEDDDDKGEDEQDEQEAVGSFTDNCDLISYSDTLLFLGEEDFEISPIQTYEGEYGSIPEGLDIDKNTGEIRVNKSESGLRYKVFFVPEESTDTCFTTLTISGVDYLTDIYILSEADSLAVPIYNGQLFSEVDEDDDNEFDDGPDDDNGNGTDDEPLPGSEVIPQGVAIDKRNGKIRLDKTVSNGIFGTQPEVGSTKKFRIYYRLGDESRKSLNKIDVQFHYYDTEDQVPEDLKNRVEELRQYYSSFRSLRGNLRVLKLFARPRPPDIIIVGRRRS